MNILSLGEKIRKIRKENKLTLKELAGDKVTQGQICLIESGKSNPSMELLRYLAKKLDVSVDYLMESETNQVDKLYLYFSNIFFVSLSLNKIEIAMEYLNKAEKLYETYKVKKHYVSLLYMKGLLYSAKNEKEKAISYLIKASLEEDVTNIKEYNQINLTAARVSIEAGDYNAALLFLKNLENLIDRNPINLKYLKNIYYKLMRVNRKLKNFDETEKYLKLTLDTIDQITNTKENADIILKEALNLESKDFDKAILYASTGKDIIDEYNFNHKQDEIFGTVGDILSKDNKHKEALGIYYKELGYSLIQNDENIGANILKVAYEELKIENYKSAQCILEYMEIENIELRPREEIRFKLLKAIINNHKKEFNKEEENLLEAYNLAKSYNFYDSIQETSLRLSKLYLIQGKTKESREYLDEYMENRKNIVFD